MNGTKQMTDEWWSKCLLDKEKLEHWLVRLYNNEKDAEERFISFANEYCKDDKSTYEIFIKIAEQERNHAILVEKVLKERNITLYEISSKNGRYFRNTIPCIHCVKTAAAIGAFAEGLSLMRMRCIINDPNTPIDLVELFKVIQCNLYLPKIKNNSMTFYEYSVERKTNNFDILNNPKKYNLIFENNKRI